MIKRLLLIMWAILGIHCLVFAQGTGSLYGTVKDRQTGEAIPYANVALFSGGNLVTGGQTDFDGKYAIRAITPGTYMLQISYVGYQTQKLQGIVIGADKAVPKDITLNPTAEMLEIVEVVDYAVPVFEADQNSSGAIITAEEIGKMPNRSAEGVVTSVSGVFSKDGEIGSIRGTRSGSQAMYIDGIRVSSLSGIPPAAYEQVALAISGISAQYGDVTSGVINVTTRGASRVFSGGAEIATSQYLDPYGYHTASLNLTGPLWVKRNKETNTSRPIMGFFLAGEFIYHTDGSPSAVGYHRLNDEQLEWLKNNPLSPAGIGTNRNTYYINPSNIDYYKNSKNTAYYRINGSARLTIQPIQNLDIAFGGYYSYVDQHIDSWENSLMNWENNGHYNYNMYRVFGRITQKFPSSGESTSLFKNFYYSVQADYERVNAFQRDPRFEDNFFNYGYLGKYDITMHPSFVSTILDTVGPHPVFVQDTYTEENVEFTPANYNSELANYTSYFTGNRNFTNLDQIRMAGGLLNGETPERTYGTFNAPGIPYNGYAKQLTDKWNINAMGSMDIGSHQLKLGFQYEQRNESYWSIAPLGLWSIMRLNANNHISEMDTDNPLYNTSAYSSIHEADTIFYNRKWGGNQSTFDWNLRKALGLAPGGLDYIYIDSYDPNTKSFTYYDANNKKQTAVLGSGQELDISLFSPEDLLQSGKGGRVLYYYGYDYTGSSIHSRRPSLEDFFSKKIVQTDPITGKTNEMLTHEIAPYSPTYMGGWIEDKFAFNDIIFTLGVRVDGFDANQKVLKDNYLLYNAYTVGQLQNSSDRNQLKNNLNGYFIPSNVGDNYVVYVDDANNPGSIMRFRNGSTWYTAAGVETSDPSSTVAGGKGIQPYLEKVNAAENKSNMIDAFADYKVKLNVMPRISFSFPISDEAVFFAHYDILTRRPSNIRMDPVTYYYFTEITSQGAINNPSLKPTQTIDYELGFKQKISNNSALSISAFYKEVRDEIQMYRYTGAYPNDYSSYNNIDFGTTKGITIDYDLRRSGNARVRAGYTLQFASGTGSSPSTQAGLIAAQLPNLRTLIPMDVDSRHQVTVSFDYRFSDGKDYNGPVIDRSKKGKTPVQVLSNAGLSVTFRGGSGTPYTRQSNITSYVRGGTKLLTGTINGSRLPWNFSIDAKIDKDFYFKMGKRKNGEQREGSINVYLACNNILNSKNIMAVHDHTGLPDDDGYIASSEGQQEANSQLSAETFKRLYELYINNPDSYSTPRTLRLGVIFGFF